MLRGHDHDADVLGGIAVCRGVDQQQEAETEGGEQAGEARAVVEGFGDHRLRGHGEQRPRSERLQPRGPRLAQRTERAVAGGDRQSSTDGDRTPEQKDIRVASARGAHSRRARQSRRKVADRERDHQRERHRRLPQSDAQNDRLGHHVERVSDRDGDAAPGLPRLDGLRNAITAALAVRGAKPREERVADAEHRRPEQQRQCGRPGPRQPDRIRGHPQRRAREQEARANRHGRRYALVRHSGDGAGNGPHQQPRVGYGAQGQGRPDFIRARRHPRPPGS
jgi:hypothetical protein